MPREQQAWYLIFGAWLVAACAMLGALFLGEVMKLPTCVLCWYQRICMFPLVVVLGLGLFPLDPRVVRYGGVLAGAGLLLALYHQAVVAGLVAEELVPCSQGVPCGRTVIEWFGIITIPLLSIGAFGTILGFLYFASKRLHNE